MLAPERQERMGVGLKRVHMIPRPPKPTILETLRPGPPLPCAANDLDPKSPESLASFASFAVLGLNRAKFLKPQTAKPKP